MRLYLLNHFNDVQMELQKQLEKLQRQAHEVERLQKLQHEEKLLKAQLLAIRWLALDNAIQAKQALISEQAESLQSDLLCLNELETTYKAQREICSQAQAQLQAAQPTIDF